jgi:hypothetical protein
MVIVSFKEVFRGLTIAKLCYYAKPRPVFDLLLSLTASFFTTTTLRLGKSYIPLGFL